jgi:formylglycine-generating enzyme required for sulfatase activity/serine/threonine protein kinase
MLEEILGGRYAIVRILDRGGMGAVYEARHTATGRRVAVKVINADVVKNPELIARFEVEAKAAGSIESRHIAQVLDAGNDEGLGAPYLVMEYLVGENLHRALGRLGALPVDLALRIAAQACIGLDKAHAAKIVHRDIKPANLFLAEGEDDEIVLKIVDFGIAKIRGDDEQDIDTAGITRTGTLVGSPLYMSPEQAKSDRAVDHRSDVWSIGVVLYQMLTGRTPHHRVQAVGALIVSICSDPPDPIRDAAPWVPARVIRVVEKALALRAEQRFQSAGEMLKAIKALLPHGHALDKSMITAVSEAERGRVPLPSTRPPSSGETAEPLTSSTAPALSAPMSGLETTEQAAPATGLGAPAAGLVTTGAVMHGPSVPAAPPKRSARSLGLVAAGAVVIAGAALAIRFGGGKERPASDRPGEAESAVIVTPASASASSAPSAASPARRTECPEGMVLVPGGRFFMGSDEPAFKLWQPAHKVTLDTFCIDVNEVTVADYKACADVGECKRPATAPDVPKPDNLTSEQHEKSNAAYAELCNFGKEGRENHPVNCVAWALADGYCKFRKRRLPTEAEWEYAARGSDGRKFPWGDEPGDENHMNACGLECNKWEAAHGVKPSPRMYNADDGYPGTAPVGSFLKGKTKFGSYDFVGNVWEWTADWFETYKPDEVVNPQGAPAGEKKAIRGGGFNGGVALWLNPAFRYHQVATASAPAIGFRCAAGL